MGINRQQNENQEFEKKMNEIIRNASPAPRQPDLNNDLIEPTLRTDTKFIKLAKSITKRV